MGLRLEGVWVALGWVRAKDVAGQTMWTMAACCSVGALTTRWGFCIYACDTTQDLGDRGRTTG